MSVEHILIRRNRILNKKTIAVWTEKELKNIGYVLKNDIKENAIVCDGDEEAEHIVRILLKYGHRVAYRNVN